MKYFAIILALAVGLTIAGSADACKVKRDEKQHTRSKRPPAKAKARPEPSGISEEDWERNDKAMLLNILRSAAGRR